MSDDPAQFGITRVYYPEQQDLEPVAYQFDSSGMSSLRAQQLANLFNGSRVKPLPELTCGGRTVKLNFDVAEISEELDAMMYAQPAATGS